MDHALPVCVVNRLANRSEEVDNLRRRWNLPFMGCLMKIVRQRLAFDVLHHHVGQGCVGTAFRLLWLHHMEIVDLHDIGMMQRSDKLGFALKARDEIRIIAQVRVQQFDGDIALQLGIESFPDLGYAAVSQSFSQFIFIEALRRYAHNSAPSLLSKRGCSPPPSYAEQGLLDEQGAIVKVARR